MDRRISILIVCLVWCLNTNIFTNYTRTRIQAIPEDRQSKIITATTILQDSQGFIWFGTINGLYRYDGYRFVFFPDSKLDHRSHIPVFALFEDHRNDIWLGTYFGGIRRIIGRQRAEPAPQENLLFSPIFDGLTIRGILEDKQGNLWIGTWGKGLFKFSRKKDQIFNYIHEIKNSISNNWIWDMALDADGEIYIGTEKGLNILNPLSESFEYHLPAIDDPATISDKKITCLFIDQKRRLWVGTERGLNLFNRKTKRFKRFLNIPGQDNSLSADWITAIAEESNGNLWIGTDGGGINILTAKENRFYNFHNDRNLNSSVGQGIRILSLFIDNSDTVWIGTSYNGLYRYDSKYQQFKHLNVSSPKDTRHINNIVWTIESDREGKIWVGSNNGLASIDLSRANIESFPIDEQYLNAPTRINQIRALQINEKGLIWTCFWNRGLFLFNPEEKTYRDMNWIHQNRKLQILTALYDRKQNLWLGTYGDGLIHFDTKNNQTYYNFNRVKKEQKYTLGAISTIYEDEKGIIWAGTYGAGLYRQNPESGKFRYMKSRLESMESIDKLKRLAVIALNDSQSGNELWVGTYGAKFGKLNKQTGAYIEPENLNQMDASTVYSIMPDKANNLWLSTEMGLYKFNMNDRQFTRYNYWDGVENIDFSLGAHHMTRQGEIILGGDKGISYFNPNHVIRNGFIPNIVLTAFKKHGQLGTKVIHNNIGNEIELSYRDSFSIEFAALNYSNAENNHYAYRISGLHNDWIYLGTRREITFNNLKPGRYHLEIKGSNNHNIWNPKGIDIRLTITPPFWLSTWFRFFIVLLFISILYYWHKTRIKRIARKLKTESAMEKFFQSHKITETEREIIRLILKGKNNKEIEEKLYISLGTVRNNVSRIYKKLNVKNRIQLINIFKNLENSDQPE